MTRRKKKKTESHTLDKYVVLCFSVLIIYIIVHTVIFAITGQEATTLSVLTFGVFGTSEPAICGVIKLYKLKHEVKELREFKESKTQEDDIPVVPEEGSEG